MKPRCLACYEVLEESSLPYHPSCLKKLFGVSWLPQVKFFQKDFLAMAQQMAGQMSISGVQPKITVGLNKTTKAFEAAPRGGFYILKPQNKTYADLPENEDLCMHLARLYDIETPRHGLVRTAEGAFAYLILRFDILPDGTRFAVEDFAQILGFISESKYSGSYEKIGKAVLQYCTNKFLELNRFFERLLFCFVTGNGDMHLKNFSLMTYADKTVALSPAYDLLSSKLVLPTEDDLPLSLMGKRNKLRKMDFLKFGESLGLSKKAMENSLERLLSLETEFKKWIRKSFLPAERQEKLCRIIKERKRRLL